MRERPPNEGVLTEDDTSTLPPTTVIVAWWQVECRPLRHLGLTFVHMKHAGGNNGTCQQTQRIRLLVLSDIRTLNGNRLQWYSDKHRQRVRTQLTLAVNRHSNSLIILIKIIMIILLIILIIHYINFIKLDINNIN
jgi:hypothetical protein